MKKNEVSKLDQFKMVAVDKEDQKKIKGGNDGTNADHIIIDSVDL